MSSILVTRPAGARDPLVGHLEERGYRVHAVPAVATVARAVSWPDFGEYDWVAVTSASAVATLPRPVPRAARWAAVGEATAAALRGRGVDADLVPETADGEALAAAIPGGGGTRVLFVRGALASAAFARAMRGRGAHVDELIVYDTVEGPAESAEPLRVALADARLAAVVFASGSAVRGFVRLGGPTTLPAITIGPRTTAVARQEGFEVVAEASAQTAVELARTVERAIPGRGEA